MDCVTPPPLTEDQLSAAIDGDADPAVVAHLAGCPACRGRLQLARQAERLLRQGLYRWDCPPPEQLGEYQLDLLGPAERAAVEAHIPGCVRCQEELAELQGFLGGPAPEPEPPPRAGAWLQAIVAQLLPRPASALRGGPRGAGESFALPGSDAVISLQWQPAADATLALIGQVADPAQERWTSALVEARRGEARVATTAVDDLGAFALERLPPGELELRIVPRGGRLVIVPQIALAA